MNKPTIVDDRPYDVARKLGQLELVVILTYSHGMRDQQRAVRPLDRAWKVA